MHYPLNAVDKICLQKPTRTGQAMTVPIPILLVNYFAYDKYVVCLYTIVWQ